ncbi:MAG TPA: hypothetical protein ACFYEK_09125 [Candidatus Wunengus sp. YC60]|uniref:hypothetical protein n=1 Tax=Candidatus Wunengus sp. YC60 TaxID=3367697 RepID=UPI0040290B5C
MNPIILYKNIFDSPIPPTATDTADGYDVLNLLDMRSYTYWQAANAGTKYITIDCSTPKTADCLSIVGHNLKTSEAVISLESSTDNASWTERIAGFTPETDLALLKTFNTATARYWRVKIVTATIAPRIAVIMSGEKIEFPYPPETPYIPYSETVELDSARSKAGHLLGALIHHKPIEIRAQFTVLSRTWIFDKWLSFWDDHGSKLYPFFYAWDKDAYPEHVYFVSCSEKMRYQTPLSIGTYVDNINLEMEGIRL